MKRNPTNIRLGENILTTSGRRLENVFNVTFFVFQDVLKTSSRRVCKASHSRRLEDVLEGEKLLR